MKLLNSLLEYSIEDELALKFKAGVIPYVIIDGKLEMLFVISSDPNYGGSDPGIIKGGADDGETPEQTALREMYEEVGIRKESIKSTTEVYSGKLTGLSTTYQMHVFAVELEEKPNLKIDSHEIAEAVWMTYNEFITEGRKSQREIVKKCVEKIGM